VYRSADETQAFYEERPGWFRLTYAQDEAELETGLSRLAAALRWLDGRRGTVAKTSMLI
jgi:hypothetical protein